MLVCITSLLHPSFLGVSSQGPWQRFTVHFAFLSVRDSMPVKHFYLCVIAFLPSTARGKCVLNLPICKSRAKGLALAIVHDYFCAVVFDHPAALGGVASPYEVRLSKCPTRVLVSLNGV